MDDKENFVPMGTFGNGCMVFSPPAKVEKPKARLAAVESLPSLMTARFQKALPIEFGTVSVHATSVQRFRLVNPNEGKSATVSVDKVAGDKGFSVVLGDGDTVVIPAGGSVVGAVYWKPANDMSVATTVTLKHDNAPLQLTLRGIAGSGQAQAAPAEKVDFATKRKALAAIADNNNRDNEHSVRRQFKPILPLPAKQQHQQQQMGSMKRMFDDKWADKQIESFTEWMNFTLAQSSAPSEDDDAKISAGATLRLLMQRRMEAQIRQRAMLIFHSSHVAVPLFALGEEISDGRMMVRGDRNVHADLGLQETLLGLLFSYELPWLRLGLEVVFGQIISLKVASGDIPCKTGDAKWKKLLKVFIFDHLFSNADIKAKPQYSQQKLLYPKNQEMLREELCSHLVKKFLALVLVLDIAREQRLLSLPTLFVNAPELAGAIKASKDVLLSFCKEFLRGEGDFIRHLGLMGYNINFNQTYTDEFDYTVSNLATDLRDGVRLTRIVEVLTKSNDLSSQLRVPAVSLMQKIHNVKLATDKIYSDKCEVDPKSIVEGNRDATLLLLWRLMFNFELKMIIDPARVRKEASAIRQNQAWRRSVYDVAEAGNFAVKVPVMDSKGAVVYPAPLPPSTHEAPQGGPCGIKGMDDSDLASALLEWCDAVAGQYGVPVYNLSSCLSDGRALCLLVHYYHPSILPTKNIKKTTQNIAAAFASNTSLDAYTESMLEVPKQEVRRALDGERRNFVTLKKACGDIGGIPTMLSQYDSNNIPEAKTMTIFLGYLFARLIESSEQVRSAIRIQRAFRRAAPELRRSLCAKVPKKAVKAKTVVSKRVVDNVVTDVCVTVVMSSHRAASIIQRTARAFIARMTYTSLVQARAEEAFRAQQEAECWAAYQAEQQAQAEREAQEAIEHEARLVADEEARIAAENEARQRAIEYERLMQEEAIQERNRLLEMHEETALRALEEAEAARAEKEAADEERERAMHEADEARALAEEEIERRADLEEKLSQYEEAQYRAQEEALALEDVRQQLEEQLAAGSITQAMLQAQLEHEQAAKLAAEAEVRAKYEELAAMDAKLAEEKFEAMRLSAAEREAEAMRVAQEQMETVVRAEKEAREAAETQARQALEQYTVLQARIKELEDSRETELAAAHEAERARLELEVRLAAELAARVEEARLEAELAAQRKFDEEAATAAAAVKAEREAREAIEEQMRAEAGARLAAEAQLLAIEEARVRQEQEAIRFAEEARLTALMRASACQLLQSAWRRCSAMAKYRMARRAVMRLQAGARGFAVRRYFAKLRLYTSFLQSIWRERRIERQIVAANAINAAAVKVQSIWRAYNQRQQFVAYTLNLSQEMAASAMHAEAVRLRREAVENSSASSIARWLQLRLTFLKVHRLVQGFRRLQASFRSRVVRRASTAEVQAMCHRLKIAEQRAKSDPSLCLGPQTQASLALLQSGKSISILLRACQTLELSTQLSVRCCEAFAQAQASSVLFGLIRSCNRSTPHQEVLRHAMIVLLNVARHPSLASSVAQSSDATDVLVDLMQMFRDKKSIFCLSCELLGRLAAASEAIKNTCNATDYRKRLDGILSIIERKHRLDARVKNIGGGKAAVEFVGSPKGRGRFLSEMEPIHGIQHLFFVLTK